MLWSAARVTVAVPVAVAAADARKRASDEAPEGMESPLHSLFRETAVFRSRASSPWSTRASCLTILFAFRQQYIILHINMLLRHRSIKR
jgi:hypothetical protein